MKCTFPNVKTHYQLKKDVKIFDKTFKNSVGRNKAGKKIKAPVN